MSCAAERYETKNIKGWSCNVSQQPTASLLVLRCQADTPQAFVNANSFTLFTLGVSLPLCFRNIGRRGIAACLMTTPISAPWCELIHHGLPPP